ncbi:hypothetical protein [Bacillus sp. AFS037270]|nr:hypothetical protein [Bacillus sp. AFS037270]
MNTEILRRQLAIRHFMFLAANDDSYVTYPNHHVDCTVYIVL